jgi:hypothetical protein
MNDAQLETEIRLALDAKAEEVRVPDDLATKTIEAARGVPRPSLLERFRAWRDVSAAKRGGSYPRWALVPAAVAGIAAFYLIGMVVMNPSGDDGTAAGAPERGAVVSDVDEGAGRDVAAPQVAPAPGGGSVIIEGPKVAEDSAGGAGTLAAPTGSALMGPKVVRNADLDIEIGRGTFNQAWARATAVASRHGGFVMSSSTEQVEGRLGRGTVTLRVPSAKMDAALADLRRLGTVLREGANADDISAPFVDVEARLKALQAQETQLLEILRRASNISDVLEVRTRLAEVRGEIESLKAQKAQMQQQVDLATITATLHEPGAEGSTEPPGPLGDAWDAGLRTAARTLAGLLVVLGVLLPLALVAGLIWGGFRVVRRKA